MKPLYTAKGIYLLIVAMVSALAGKAQADLESASGGGPVGTGPTIAAQAVTLKENTNNPTGNTFVAWSSPTTTATYSFSNQQYTLPTSQMSTGYPMVFGGAINSGGGQNALNASVYSQMSAISAPSNSNFTSVETVTAGTGISTTNNYGSEFMISAMPLYNAGLSTTGRYYMGDLTITFNTPLTDPVIHFVGIGANYSNLGFASEFDLTTAGVSLSELSGSSEMSVVGNNIVNNKAHPGPTTGSGAASGSILAMGVNITTLKFQVWVHGDGGETTWANSTTHAGDQIIISVSANIPNTVLTVALNDFRATAQSGKTQLQWSTASESNTNMFDVQFSTDQLNWQSIGTVKAAGNSTTENQYSFVHTTPAPGNNYYRIRTIDLDGEFFYSPIREVTFGDNIQLSFYPNPTKGRCTITSTGTTLSSVTVMAIDGRALQQVNNFVSGNSIDISGYPAGVYLLVVKDDTGNSQILKVLKN